MIDGTVEIPQGCTGVDYWICRCGVVKTRFMVIQIPVLAMFCMLSPLLWAQDGANQAAASKILALESVWNQAEENGDIGSLDLIFDSALIYIDEDGSLLT